MGFVFVLLVASVPLTGGRLARLAGVTVRLKGVIVLALALQIVVTSVLLEAPAPLLIALHLLSYVLVAWALWANRATPGLLLIGAGGGTNGVVIALNGGTLPADASALADAGIANDPQAFTNSGVVGDPVLAWLGDIAATPGWLPFQNVISIGDVVVLVGAAVMLHVTCRTRLCPSSRRRPRSEQEDPSLPLVDRTATAVHGASAASDGPANEELADPLGPPTSVTVLPATSDRLEAPDVGVRPSTGPVMSVRQVSTSGATPDAGRSCTDVGRVLPAHGQTVPLHRLHAGSGLEVRPAPARVVDGRYRVDRRFTGSGFRSDVLAGQRVDDASGAHAPRAVPVL